MSLGAVVAFASLLFGFPTLIGWRYYGEQCLKYLFGVQITCGYRIVFTREYLSQNLSK